MRPGSKEWTGLERDRLKAWRAAGVSYVECARRLGRSEGSVSGMAHHFRFTSQAKFTRAAVRRKAVRGLHARGWTPVQMARKFGLNLNALCRDHAVLGLIPHRIESAERGRMSRRACVRANGKCSGQLRRERERVASFQAGWPAVGTVAARHLDLFFRLGPATATAHHERIGLRHWRTTEDHVQRLHVAGHLVVVGRAAWRARVYDLAPEVRVRRERVLAYQSKEIPA